MDSRYKIRPRALHGTKPREAVRTGVARSYSLRDPGNLKGCRFFHLQSILDYLDRAAQRECRATAASESPATAGPGATPSLKGLKVFLANALTAAVTST